MKETFEKQPSTSCQKNLVSCMLIILKEDTTDSEGDKVRTPRRKKVLTQQEAQQKEEERKKKYQQSKVFLKSMPQNDCYMLLKLMSSFKTISDTLVLIKTLIIMR